jgi:hypothetical protein
VALPVQYVGNMIDGGGVEGGRRHGRTWWAWVSGWARVGRWHRWAWAFSLGVQVGGGQRVRCSQGWTPGGCGCPWAGIGVHGRALHASYPPPHASVVVPLASSSPSPRRCCASFGVVLPLLPLSSQGHVSIWPRVPWCSAALTWRVGRRVGRRVTW